MTWRVLAGIRLTLADAWDEEERRRSAAPLPGRSSTAWSRAACDAVLASTDRRSAGKQQLAIAAPLRPEGKRDRASCRSSAGGRRLCRAHISWITGRPRPHGRRDFCNRGNHEARFQHKRDQRWTIATAVALALEDEIREDLKARDEHRRATDS